MRAECASLTTVGDSNRVCSRSKRLQGRGRGCPLFASYAAWLSRPASAKFVVAVTAVIAVIVGFLAGEVNQDDDVLAFLPKNSPEIAQFYAINDAFGGLDVALIGVETEDVFDKAFIEKLKAATKALEGTPGLVQVLSLANVQDVAPDPVMGGMVAALLVDKVPESDAEEAALRDRVMSRDQVAGNLVSRDGKAVQILAFVQPGKPSRDTAMAVREVVKTHFTGEKTYEAGAPFIAAYIYDTTQADMARLTPWAVLAIVVILIASFRDLVGSMLGLIATGLGILTSRAAMAVTGVRFNIVLGSMPVILFAVGSAYGIHFLAHYTRHRRDVDGPEAIRRALVGTGPSVLFAGLTTIAGLSSFLTMDIAPMRVFGGFTAVGLAAILFFALTFVPAAILLLDPKSPPDVGTTSVSLTTRLMTAVQGARGAVSGALLVVTLGFGALITQVDSRMDLGAFFAPGSSPDQGLRFMENNFGGSQFVQIHVKGDVAEPHVLRELGRLADKLRVLPGVSQVNAPDRLVATANDLFDGTLRVPNTPEQVGTILGFLTGNPAVKQLVNEPRDQALIHVKLIDSTPDGTERVLAEIRRLVAAEAPTSLRLGAAQGADRDAAKPQIDGRIAGRAVSVALDLGLEVPSDAHDKLVAALNGPAVPPDAAAVEGKVKKFLLSDECFVRLSEEQAGAVATAITPLGAAVSPEALTTTIRAALAPIPPLDPASAATAPDDLTMILQGTLGSLWQQQIALEDARRMLDAAGITIPTDARGDRLVRVVAGALMDRADPVVALAGTGEGAKALQFEVSGIPVLYEGLSRSVEHNQLSSLSSALITVFLLLSLRFRSITSGLVATAPTAITLAVIYGAMGALGVRLDIGTSMIASLILGAGVDYAIHSLGSWEGADPAAAAANASHETAHAVWTNAAMVAAGFSVLTLGEARPLQNLGGLTAAAMVIAAVSTFITIPALARRSKYL